MASIPGKFMQPAIRALIVVPENNITMEPEPAL